MNKNIKELISTELNHAIYQALIKRIPPNHLSEHLEDIVSLLIHTTLNGDLSIDLDLLDEQMPIEIKAEGWPKDHMKALISSGWLEGDSSPMVLDSKKLSWRRSYIEIKELTQRLISKSKCSSKKENSSLIKKPEYVSSKLNKEQISAIKAIEDQSVVLLSGGPGTGKTSTILQMIIQAIAIQPNIKIGLAAPTGKATRRLRETLEKGLNKIHTPLEEKVTKLCCKTLHKWLGAKPGGFSKNVSNPLNLDLLVIDEISMVDIHIMKALINAFPEKSQLILVGDPDQLPPIGSASIWNELQQKEIRACFGKGAIHLKTLYRNNGAIASLSEILRSDGLNSFWKEVSSLKSEANVSQTIATTEKVPEIVLTHLKKHLQSLKRILDSLTNELLSKEGIGNLTKKVIPLLEYMEELMVLCPRRHGQWSIEQIHKEMLGNNLEKGVFHWGEGTPVMCSENQPDLGLANGDIGIVVGEGQQKRLLFKVLTDKQELQAKLINPARIKNIEPAFSMTIHKSQGSEANHVILLWPQKFYDVQSLEKNPQNNEAYEKRLIYTAITRARGKLNLIVNQT